MVKKLTLDIDYENAFLILGIVTTFSDYQLAHHVNKALNVNFIKYDDFPFHGNKNNPVGYAWFYCKSDELKIKSYLIANHHSKQKLLSDYRHIDYLLIIDKSGNSDELNQIVSVLREIKKISGVFKLNPSKIKEIDLLLEQNEMHELSQI